MSSKGFSREDGDWLCEDEKCNNMNFARRDTCNRCGKERSDAAARLKKLGIEIGKQAAEKSKGLFSADDWQCSKCGNVNWARRGTCNLCNAPKVAEVEERTGYGGGFNERVGVEYKEREESDDEFDEFGRKKKKFRLPTGLSGSESDSRANDDTKTKSVSKKPQVDDESEEDDDDDGDLSKYDLSGWGDEEEEESSSDKKVVDSKGNKDSVKESRDQDRDGRSRDGYHKRKRSYSRSRSRSRSRDRSREKADRYSRR